MIYVTHAVPVNEDGQPHLTRDDVWEGLVLKANDALPFVPAMTRCVVTARHGDDVFDREVEFRGQSFTERITLEAPHRVVFTRIAGGVLGTIELEAREGGAGTAGGLFLRFSYALAVTGVEPGSAAETAYAEGMSADYLKAVEATLAAVRARRTGTAPRPAGAPA